MFRRDKFESFPRDDVNDSNLAHLSTLDHGVDACRTVDAPRRPRQLSSHRALGATERGSRMAPETVATAM